MKESTQNILIAAVILILLFLVASFIALSFNPVSWDIVLRCLWGVSSAVIILVVILNIIEP
jgi:hypothetical protein